MLFRKFIATAATILTFSQSAFAQLESNTTLTSSVTPKTERHVEDSVGIALLQENSEEILIYLDKNCDIHHVEYIDMSMCDKRKNPLCLNGRMTMALNEAVENRHFWRGLNPLKPLDRRGGFARSKAWIERTRKREAIEAVLYRWVLP